MFGGSEYRDALVAAQQAWRTPQQLPSARVLDAIGRTETCATPRSCTTRAADAAALLALPWSHEQQARFEREAQQSLAAAGRDRSADTMPFEAFRQDYVSADRLMPALATAA